MKKLTIIIIVLFFYNNINAQIEEIRSIVVSTNFTYNMVNPSQHQFVFRTWFMDGPNCRTLSNQDFSFIDNIMYVKGYYNICPPRITTGNPCMDISTITYNDIIPSNIQYIICSTNVIHCQNNLNITETINDVYTRTFDLSNLRNVAFNTTNSNIYPNPTKDILNLKTDALIKEIIIYDSLGKTILKTNQNYDKIDVSTLNKGVYLIKIVDKNDNSSFNKFLKE